MTRILLLEDDGKRAGSIRGGLSKYCGLSDQAFLRIETEHEFITSEERIRKFSPTIAIFDIIVAWTIPSPEMPPMPERIKNEGRYIAGLRCAEFLHRISPNTLIVLYTIVDPKEVERCIETQFSSTLNVSKVIQVSKEEDVTVLFDQIRELARQIR